VSFLRRSTTGRRSRWLVGTIAAALLLTACGDGDGTTTDDGDDTAQTDADDGDDAAAGNVGEGRTVDLAWIPWEEAIAMTNLWQVILEDNGFEVEQTQLDPGLVYDGLANGDVDVYLDAWLPNTHADYWEEYGDRIDELSVVLDEAPLTWAVPAYVDDVDSIADLQGNADMFGGQIIGIEAGSGLMRISADEVMPTYDLEGEYDLIDGSTAAMLAELEAAIANEEPIVVTLWEPHPAYGRFELKNLDDPEQALGEPDEIRAVARQGFGDDFPEVAAAMSNFEFDAGTLADLTVSVLEEHDDELEGARAWLEANTDVVEAWLDGTGLTVSAS
jgi:glycine betaine/proline transport system substrate-binding protein